MIIAIYWPIVFLFTDALWNNGQAIDLQKLDDLFLNKSQLDLLVNSLAIGCGATLLSILMGVPFAFLCDRTAFFGLRFFKWLYLIPILIPPYIHAIVWSDLLATNGAVNHFFLDTIGFLSSPIDINSQLGVIVILALAYFPFITVMTMSGLRGLDKRYEEASQVQHSDLQTVLRITLSLVSPYIISGAIFVFIFSIIDFGVADFLRVRVYPVDIFIQYSALYDEQAAVLLAIPLLVITAVFIGIQLKIMKGKAFFNLPDSNNQHQKYDSRMLQVFAFLFCFIVITLSVGVPIVSLINMLDSFSDLMSTASSSFEQFIVSFTTAATGSITMVLLAFVIAHSMLKASGRNKLIMEYATQLPLAIPPILLGIGLVKAWNRPVTDWVYSSSFIIVLGYIAHFLPFAIRIIYSNLRQINPVLEEAGALCQQSQLIVVRRIVLPLAANGIFIGFFITFILALGELGTSLLIMPPGLSTLPIKIYNYLHYGALASVASLCLLLLVSQLMLSMGLFGMKKWFYVNQNS